MRFQLPQFLETEVKIIGPLTLKQFLWVASGAAIVFLIFISVGNFLFLILAIPVGAIFLALAFVKIDGTPLLYYLAYGFSYILNPKKYFFKKDANDTKINYEIKKEDGNKK